MRGCADCGGPGYFAVTEEPGSWTEAYASLNVRMINVSLPGLALSSLHPDRGLDPHNVTLSGDRVLVWYAADDEDCPPSHGKWLAAHFGARTRVFEGYGHLGGALIDHPGFLRELTD